MEHSQALARRLQEDADHRRHSPFVNTLRDGQFRIVADTRAKNRLAAHKGAVSSAIAELRAAARIIAAGGQGAEPQVPTGSIREHDGATLRIESSDRIIQYRVQQLVFVFDVAEIVTGTQQ